MWLDVTWTVQTQIIFSEPGKNQTLLKDSLTNLNLEVNNTILNITA